MEKVNNLNSLFSSVSTRKITKLSKIAFGQLITKQLKEEFNNELKLLELDHLSVDLELAEKNKGVVNMVMKLNGNDIKTILSEGEQKGVGLALFVTETKLCHITNPIIFDDPVTSLDHRIAGNFANILMGLDNQVIVFTHNRLFLDAFECSKENHICKNIYGGCNSSKGKHIYLLQVQSEGKNDRGVIISKDKDNASDYIEKAKKLLKQNPFLGAQQTATNIRIAIEHIIDEKIFNGQVPTKFSNKNSRIQWEALKNMCNDKNVINTLNTMHSRVSGGELHVGVESRENEISQEEYLKMVYDLEEILTRVR